jgi:UDP-glucose 4-epimerase
MITTFERVTGRPVRWRPAGRRPGDVAGAFTRGDKAAQLLGWRPGLSLADGIRDSLHWAEVRDTRLG